MSKISLKPNASGTGVFSLEAPNSNVDRTLTLPDEAGSVLTNVSDIESQVKTATNATGSAPVYACRAWVNFDGTGTVSIRDSENVSSITDNGTGQYLVNFATAMPDASYAVQATAAFNVSNPSDINAAASSSSATEANVHLFTSNTDESDGAQISVSVFR